MPIKYTFPDLFEQLAFREGANDIAVSVTTGERVGRTMVVRAIEERLK
jgi:hypothetical protein